MSSLVTSAVRSVAGKITRSPLVTRRSRPPASSIVTSDAIPLSSTLPEVRLLLIGLAALAIAGCGGGDDAAPPAVKRPADPCSARMTAAAGAGAHASLVSREPDVVTCRYAGGAGSFRVTVDKAPQAWFRWQRGQVERIQTASEWAHTPAQQARDVPGVGGGAFWVRGPRELVTSDGKLLLTVRVERPHRDKVARRAAIKVARAGLGPVDIPKRTGP